MKKLINSFKYAIEGIASSLKTERNLKIHITMMCLVIIAGMIFKISRIEWCICLILFGLVLSAELFNTAIETVVNLVMPEYHELAKKAKDISAGGVLILAIISAILGVMLFLPKILAMI